jgi:hypothetical protein
VHGVSDTRKQRHHGWYLGGKVHCRRADSDFVTILQHGEREGALSVEADVGGRGDEQHIRGSVVYVLPGV